MRFKQNGQPKLPKKNRPAVAEGQVYANQNNLNPDGTPYNMWILVKADRPEKLHVICVDDLGDVISVRYMNVSQLIEYELIGTCDLDAIEIDINFL